MKQREWDTIQQSRFPERLKRQFAFLTEIDQMKSILRRTLLADGSRRENDAEHSWHFAVMAMVLEEYAPPDMNMLRVLKMALVHDLVEVYAGDTFAYDVEGYRDKAEREKQAADRLFGLLPVDQGRDLRELWKEFEAMETTEAMYAAAIDRIQPLLNNYYTEGHTWRSGQVTLVQVRARLAPVRKSIPQIGEFFDFLLEDSLKKGFIQE